MYNRYRPSNMISTSGISEIVALVPERYLDKQGHGKQFPSLPGSLARPSLTPSCCSQCGNHHCSDCLLAPVKPHLFSTNKTPFLPSFLHYQRLPWKLMLALSLHKSPHLSDLYRILHVDTFCMTPSAHGSYFTQSGFALPTELGFHNEITDWHS